MMKPDRCRYVDFEQGQLHLRDWFASTNTRCVICMPPVPYSSIFFKPLAQALDGRVRIISIDPPGYGHSDNVPRSLTIEDIADAVITAARELDLQQFEMLGFHTGTLVSLAVAEKAPDLVSHLHLIDAPTFDPKRRRSLLEGTPTQREFNLSLDCLESIWQFNVARHEGVLSTERTIELLTDDLASGIGQPMGFRAAFLFNHEQCIAQLNRTLQARVVATASTLREPTIRLGTLLEQGPLEHTQIEEWPEVTHRVFDDHAMRVAQWLSEVH